MQKNTKVVEIWYKKHYIDIKFFSFKEVAHFKALGATTKKGATDRTEN